MNRKVMLAALAAALAGAALAACAEERVYRIESDYAHRIARAPEWNVAAAQGMCRLRIWVDDRARVKLHGDEITVETDSGKRSFDQGSVCTQPLPDRPVDNFHVAVERGRGTVMEVREPDRRNDYTGTVSVVDPQNGGDTYELVMAWNSPGVASGTAPLPPTTAPTFFGHARACQDKVRAEFLQRNRDGAAYVEFDSAPTVDHLGMARGHIRGEAWAHNRNESRRITYRCTIDNDEQRVLSASYDVNGPRRLSSPQ